MKLLNQNTRAHIYSYNIGLSAVYPMLKVTGDSIGQTYIEFSHFSGAPECLTFDGETAQVVNNTLLCALYRSMIVNTMYQYQGDQTRIHRKL